MSQKLPVVTFIVIVEAGDPRRLRFEPLAPNINGLISPLVLEAGSFIAAVLSATPGTMLVIDEKDGKFVPTGVEYPQPPIGPPLPALLN